MAARSSLRRSPNSMFPFAGEVLSLLGRASSIIRRTDRPPIFSYARPVRAPRLFQRSALVRRLLLLDLPRDAHLRQSGKAGRGGCTRLVLPVPGLVPRGL